MLAMEIKFQTNCKVKSKVNDKNCCSKKKKKNKEVIFVKKCCVSHHWQHMQYGIADCKITDDPNGSIVH